MTARKRRQTVQTGLGERTVPEPTAGLSGTALTLYRAIALRSSRLRDQLDLLLPMATKCGASSGDVEAVREFLRRDTFDCRG